MYSTKWVKVSSILPPYRARGLSDHGSGILWAPLCVFVPRFGQLRMLTLNKGKDYDHQTLVMCFYTKPYQAGVSFFRNFSSRTSPYFIILQMVLRYTFVYV